MPDEQPAPRKAAAIAVTPKGTSGTKRWGGRIQEEYLPALSGVRAIDMYDRMRRSDALVRTLWLVTTLPILSAEWEVELGLADPDSHPKGEVARAEQVREYVREMLFERADRTFTDMLRESLLYLVWGFVVQYRALYLAEGRVWLKDLYLRHPRSFVQHGNPWVFDGDQLVAMVQVDYYAGGSKPVPIPRSEVLLLTNEQEGANVEGISSLRPLYRPYFYKDQFLTILGIGLEKQAIGTAVGKIQDPQNEERREKMEQAIRDIRAGEEAGLVLGLEDDLTIVAGELQAEHLLRAIEYCDHEMAKAWLAGFLNLGHGQGPGGSYALSADQSDLFMLALEARCEFVADGWTKDVIRPLVELNFGPQALRYIPKLRARVRRESKANIADMLVKLTTGTNPILTFSEDDEDAARQQLDLPPRTMPRREPMAPMQTGPAAPGGKPGEPQAANKKPDPAEDPQKPQKPEKHAETEGAPPFEPGACDADAQALADPVPQGQQREAPAYPELAAALADFHADVDGAVARLKAGLAEVLQMADAARGWIFGPKPEKRVERVLGEFVEQLAGDASSAAGFASANSGDGIFQANIVLTYATGVVHAAAGGPSHLTVRRDSPEVRALLREAFSRMSEGGKARFAAGELERLKAQIAAAMREGLSPKETLAKIEAAVDGYDRRVLRRIVNTEGQRAATAGNVAELAAGGVAAVQFVAGPYACARCRSHDGDVVPVEEAVPGVNLAPIHPHCYCSERPAPGERYASIDEVGGPYDVTPAPQDRWESDEARRAAEQWALRNIPGLQHVDYSGVDPDVAQSLNRVVSDIARKFEVEVEAIMPYTWSGWGGQATDAMLSAGRNGIAYNPARCQGSPKLEELDARSRLDRTAAASKDLDGIIAHEMSHVLVANGRYRAGSRFPEGFGEYLAEPIVTAFRKKEKAGRIVPELGLYAWLGRDNAGPTAWKETLAEAFSAYYRERASLRKPTRRMVEKVLRRLYPKVKL